MTPPPARPWCSSAWAWPRPRSGGCSPGSARRRPGGGRRTWKNRSKGCVSEWLFFGFWFWPRRCTRHSEQYSLFYPILFFRESFMLMYRVGSCKERDFLACIYRLSPLFIQERPPLFVCQETLLLNFLLLCCRHLCFFFCQSQIWEHEQIFFNGFCGVSVRKYRPRSAQNFFARNSLHLFSCLPAAH